MIDWALYRSFLEVLRTGSQSQAARRLGLSQPTIRRHIEMLERDLGRTLFLRSPSGLAPTDLAQSMRSSVEAMEALDGAIERRAAAQDMVTGTVRISASRMIAAEVLPTILAELQVAEPGIRFEIDDSNDQRDLLHRAADVAVRMVQPTQLDLIQSHVGQIEIGFFAHRSWIARHGQPRDMAAVVRSGALLGFDRDPMLERQWEAHLPGLDAQSFALRSDNDTILLAALRAGMGIGACQCPLAERDPDLVPVLPDWTTSLGIWVVTHPDLRTDRPTSRVYQHLGTRLAEYARISG